MAQQLPIVREEHLQKLEPFCRALAEALGRAGLEPGKVFAAFRTGVTAECVQCHIHVPGEELFALSLPAPDSGADAKDRRLRLGYCARQGCESYFYRLTFLEAASLDWPKFIEEAEAIQQGQLEATGHGSAVREFLCRAAHSTLVRRVALGTALAMVLLLARQWHLGGRIPLLREPEHFRVATVRPGAEQKSLEPRGGNGR